ncbi:MAG TPA: MFS transporter, partial [Candidatus Dormibacteraeota bacterium]
IVGIPGLLFALGAWGMREPLRGATEKGPSLRKTADAGLKQFFELLRIPTLRYTIIAQTLLFFVLASNAFWLPTVLQRRFELSSTNAGLLAGGVIVIGGLIGTLAGGWIADRRAMTTPRAHLEVGIAGFLAGAVLVAAAILSPLNIGPIPVFVPAFLLGVVALYLYAGPFTALSQNVVSPGLRASAVTALIFIAHVFGDSHAPFDVGLISDWLGGNLQLALLITSPTLLLAAAGVASLGLRTVKADTEKMEREWEARGAELANQA